MVNFILVLIIFLPGLAGSLWLELLRSEPNQKQTIFNKLSISSFICIVVVLIFVIIFDIMVFLIEVLFRVHYIKYITSLIDLIYYMNNFLFVVNYIILGTIISFLVALLWQLLHKYKMKVINKIRKNWLSLDELK
ncbi:hypothetical protein [Chengkuizengella axinellae]|uniref:Uncharacterized protein n=1 Tax=Chengkuizengella axinellae TaxID=3064388 RepID=A0ABT9IXF7_9BACL|nr:hypothetical protein [Chengkuizengella sp. 2205SS18-9]MDP5274054.1 hypothetical protein [Chengkuizengella sp. 2205SS18-9]